MSSVDPVPRVKRFELNWFSIEIGVFVALVLLLVSYFLFGLTNTFFYGMLVVSVVVGCVTGVLARSKDVYVDDTLNSLVNGSLTGLIAGFVFIVVMNFLKPGLGAAFVFVPGYVMFAFLGAVFGVIINAIRQQNTLIKVISAVIIVGLVSFLVYFVFFSGYDHEERFYEESGSQFTSISLADYKENEIVKLFNGASFLDSNNKTLLNKTKIQYGEMLSDMIYARDHNRDMVGYGSSDVQKEYAVALGELIDLKYDYYNDMETAVGLVIKGNKTAAREHYEKAQKLLPQIENQELKLEKIENKDSKLKNLIEKERKQSQRITKKLISEGNINV